MREASTLTLAAALRPGERLADGTYRTERRFLDFVVDGRSLYAEFGKRNLDLVSFLVSDLKRIETTQAVGRLLLEEPPDLPNERSSLYICPECGDLGCGAVTIRVERLHDVFVWRDFGIENNYESLVQMEQLAGLGPFSFRLEEYSRVLRSAITQLEKSFTSSPGS